jgi:uncharacterized protein YqeY
MLHLQLREGIKEAMKARDEVRLMVLRGLVTAATNELVSKSRKPDEVLSDEDMLVVIKRGVKQHKDSIEQFEKGNRQDLADKEKAELVILEAYLPKTMSQEEIRPIAEKKKTEMNISDKKEAGKLMGAIMKELGGKAEGTDVKAVVDSFFAES